MYAYCGNNPVNYSDPSGNIAVSMMMLYGAAAAVTAVLAVKAIEETAEVVKSVVREAIEKQETKQYEKHSVYVLVNESKEVMYVGRTRDPKVREQQHKRDSLHKERQYYQMIVVTTGLTLKEARATEQIIISAYVTASERVNGKLQGLDNAIRSIAPSKVEGFRGCLGKALQLFGTVLEDELINLMGR